ncbi:MAG: S41 family peptidase [Bacteroidales bacterium]
MQKKKNNLFVKGRNFVIVALISLSIVVSAGFVNKNFELTKNLDIFATLYRELALNYVDEVNPSELINTAINSMLGTLDPYTNFIPESEIEDYRFMTTGKYGGIGALIQYRDSTVVISQPYKDFPAYKAGLIAGDVILEVNGVSTSKLGLDDVRELLHGQPDTEVELLVKRYGEEEAVVKTVVREIIQVDNVPYYSIVNDNYGYIKLTGFTQSASAEFIKAFDDLRNNNEIEGLIIDLRGNGGGLLNEAVNIVNLFVEKDQIVVETKGKIEERNTSHKTLNQPVAPNIPLTILTDMTSASASEIVAGAIQDFDRGVIVGERTFGKGLVQNIVPLTYNTQLKVTIAKYYIPSGRCIQAVDYAKRNEDGSIAKIPDSLKVEFTTKNGRIVYDGGGIEPDVNTAKDTTANITYELMRKYMIFDYASKFYHENNEIAAPEEFEITEDIYNDFIEFTEKHDFDFSTESEKHLELIAEKAKEESYYEYINNDISELHNKLLSLKENDIYEYRDQIKMLLKDEIVSRYYYTNGRIRASMKVDKDINEALEILKDKNRYNSILSTQN